MTADHHIEIIAHHGELRLRLTCTATKGAPCRKRPANPDVEFWNEGDPNLIDAEECWATEWIDGVGFEEAVKTAADGTLGSIPVTVAYDDGVQATPAEAD